MKDLKPHPTVGFVGIGIPTFNRYMALRGECESLLNSAHLTHITLAVVDDGSSDGTAELLQTLRTSHSNFRFTRHPTNLGYAQAFATTFETLETEWVVMNSDDDHLVPEELSVLALLLERADFDFLCTRWVDVDGRIARGRASNRRISPKHVQAAANHAPALVFRRTAVLPILPTLRRLCDERNLAALTYPQVVVAAHLVADGRARWNPLVLGREGERLPSGLADERGRPYWHPEARVDQAISFGPIYRTLVRSHSRMSMGRWRARRIQMTNERLLFGTLDRLVKTKDPDHDHLLFTAIRSLLARL